MKQLDPIPHMTHPPRKPTTRGDSKKKEQEEKNQDTHQDQENSDQEDEPNHTPFTSNMQPAQHQENQGAEATGFSTNAITSMVVHMVQGIATIGEATAHLLPGSAITENNSMGERQDPDGSPQIILPPAPPPPLNLPPAQPAPPPPLILPTAPPPLLHAPHENNKGGARTPKNDKRKKWPHERPAFKAAAAAAANSVVDLLNPGGQSARLDDATF